jgi:hypothetical protein
VINIIDITIEEFISMIYTPVMYAIFFDIQPTATPATTGSRRKV